MDSQPLLERMLDRWNAGDRDGYLASYHPDVVLHGFPPDLPPGREGLKAFYAGIWEGFPDARLHLATVLAVGPLAAVRFRLEATHTGPLMGAPPTGRPVALEAVTAMRFQEGLCVERWADQAAALNEVMRQLA